MKPENNAKTFIEECVGTQRGTFIAASDYVKTLPLAVSGWFPGSFTALGTDGFGLSEDRENLRDYFEVNAHHIVWAALAQLYKEEKIDKKMLDKGKKHLKIREDKNFPRSC